MDQGFSTAQGMPPTSTVQAAGSLVVSTNPTLPDSVMQTELVPVEACRRKDGRVAAGMDCVGAKTLKSSNHWLAQPCTPSCSHWCTPVTLSASRSFTVAVGGRVGGIST